MTCSFTAIGTQWQVDLPGISAEREISIEQLVRNRIALFEQTYSRFRGDSFVAKMQSESGVFILPPDAKPMLDLYEALYHLTEGAFTPLIGSVLSEAGYDKLYRLVPHELHTPPAWKEVLEYSFPTLTTLAPVSLDFGGLGKGYIVDIVSMLLEKEGITTYTIDAGGDMCHRSDTEVLLRVGLEVPGDSTKAIGVAFFGNKSLCGSSGSRRAWANFHHIIDPHTLLSPRDIIATWVVAETTLLADAMATCLFLVAPEKLERAYVFDYLILHHDFSITKSTGFPAELFV